jgi:hypothetical protein
MTDPRSRRTRAPPQAPALVSRTLKYKQTQEHLLRRLAGALVLQWDAVPDEVQDLIIDQAAPAEDREDAPHQAADFESFIRHAKTAALTRPAQTPASDVVERGG